MALTDGPVALMYNFRGVVFGLVQFALPFMILTLVGVIKGIPPSLEEAARSLGASRRRAFMRVTCPPRCLVSCRVPAGLCLVDLVLYCARADGWISRRRLADPHLPAGRRKRAISVWRNDCRDPVFDQRHGRSGLSETGKPQFRGACLMERKIPLPMLVLAILGFCYLLFPILVVVLGGPDNWRVS